MSGNGGTATYVASFAFAGAKMRVAGKDDAPLKQKRKAAFALVAPTKQPAKLQFSTANVGKKPGAKEEEKEEQAMAQKDGKLQQWLKAGNGDRPGMEEAREYLLRGIPYKGTHARNTKEAIKETGGKWHKNPLKLNDEFDGISPGWFCAMSEQVLTDLIRMPKIKKEQPPWMAKYKDREEWQSQWVPIDVPEKSFDNVVLLIIEYEMETKEKLELAAKAATRARNAKEAARLNSQRHNDIPLDSEAEIAELKERFGIKWTDDMSAEASRSPVLGPHSGISSCRRAMRGLHLKVCTADEVRTGRYISDAINRAKANSKNDKGAGSSDEPTFTDYNKIPITSASSGCYMFGTGPGMIRLPNEKEWEKLKEKMQEKDALCVRSLGKQSAETPFNKETWCTSCVCRVIEQFNDCSCSTRTWTWCVGCYHACCLEQDCSCEEPGEWARKQSACLQEAEKRTEKAERDLQLAGHLDTTCVNNAVRDDDRPPEVQEEVGVDTGETLDDFFGW